MNKKKRMVERKHRRKEKKLKAKLKKVRESQPQSPTT